MARDLVLPISTPADTSGIDKTVRHLDRLDRQLEETSREAARLRKEFAATGDLKLLPKIAKEERLEAKLRRIRKQLDDVGDEADQAARKTAKLGLALGADVGAGMGKGILDTLGKIPAQAKGGMIVGLVGIAVAAAPMIGAVISGAVIGAVGIGGIAGGIALAARHPAVKDAASQFAQQVGSAFAPIGAEFVGPVVAGLGILGDEVSKFAGKLDLGPLAKQIPNLAKGLGEFGEKVLPGLNKALATGGRIVGIFSDELGDLGDAIGDAFGAMASEEGTVLGFIALMDLLQTTIRVTGETLRILGVAFHDTVSVGAKVTGFMEDWTKIAGVLAPPLGFLSDVWANQNDHLEEMLKQLNATPEQAEAVRNIFNGLGGAGRDLAKDIDKATDSFGRLFDKWMAVDEAKIAVEKALDEIAASFDENGRSIDINTEKGRENAEALLGGVQALYRQRQAMIDNGTSIAYANDWYDKQLRRLRDTAIAHGGVAAEVDKVIGKWGQLTKMPDIYKSINVAVKYSSSGTPPASRQGQLLFQEKGGIVAAQHGMIARKPTVLFGERPTGIEGFVPQRGISRGRAFDLMSEIGSWHNMSVVPSERLRSAPVPMSGAPTAALPPVVVNVYLDSEQVYRALVDLAARRGQTPAQLWPDTR